MILGNGLVKRRENKSQKKRGSEWQTGKQIVRCGIFLYRIVEIVRCLICENVFFFGYPNSIPAPTRKLMNRSISAGRLAIQSNLI